MEYGGKLMFDIGISIITVLSEKYNFNAKEASEYLNLVSGLKLVKETKKPTGKRVSVVMPFCGIVCDSRCRNIRLNHGLYTQCVNEDICSVNGNRVCKTCENQIKKQNSSTYGYISERIEKGRNYVTNKGKYPIKYGNIMEKLNISREEAEEEALMQGLTIPESEYEVTIATRGRPKIKHSDSFKSNNEIEINQDDNQDETKERVKSKKERKESTKERKESTKERKNGERVKSNKQQKNKEISVIPITINNINYLKHTKNNSIYDAITYDFVGVYDAESNTLTD
jgi:hypothetical protein